MGIIRVLVLRRALGHRRAEVVDEGPEWGHLEPVNTTLICTKIRNTFGIKQMPWRTWLSEEVAMLKESNSAERVPANS